VERQSRPQGVQGVRILLADDDDSLVSGILFVLEPSHTTDFTAVYEPSQTTRPESERFHITIPGVLCSEDRRSILHSIPYSRELARDDVDDVRDEGFSLLA